MKARWMLLFAVLVLAGCGVRPTEPVAAGEAPVGVASGPMLFFVRDGKVRPVIRETGRLGTATGAVALLLGGPTAAESGAGYTTELPPATVGASVSVMQEGVVTVSLAPSPVYLSRTATEQLVCTVVAVEAQLGASASGVGVRIAGGGPTVSLQQAGNAMRCPVIP